MNTKEAFSEAEKYAILSVENNSTRASSFSALGMVNLFFKWNFLEAEANFRKAITLEPNHIDARIGLGYLYRALGEHDRMIKHLKIATKLDPLSAPAKVELARAQFICGEYEKSVSVLKNVLELDPMFVMAYEDLSYNFIQLEDMNTAKNYIDKFSELASDTDFGIAVLGYVAGVSGDKDTAEKHLAKLQLREKEHPELNFAVKLAYIYAGIGEVDTTLEYLNLGYKQHIGTMIFIDTLLPFRNLSTEPRFREIRNKIGLPDLH